MLRCLHRGGFALFVFESGQQAVLVTLRALEHGLLAAPRRHLAARTGRTKAYCLRQLIETGLDDPWSAWSP